MSILYKISIILIFLNLISCAKKEEKITVIEEKSLEMQMIDAYNEGLEELEKNDVIYAAKKFNEAELIYPNQFGPRELL